jgi:hypothetical protein
MKLKQLSNPNVIDLLNNFLSAVEVLKAENIIRSDRYLGDIGEFICQRRYNLVLNENLREKGYDAITEHNRKIEIKYHTSAIGTNVEIGDPHLYDDVYVLLSPRSKLYKKQNHNSEGLEHCCIQLSSESVSKLMQTNSLKRGNRKLTVGKIFLFKNGITDYFSLEELFNA